VFERVKQSWTERKELHVAAFTKEGAKVEKIRDIYQTKLLFLRFIIEYD
jgi:hypothetical protein